MRKGKTGKTEDGVDLDICGFFKCVCFCDGGFRMGMDFFEELMKVTDFFFIGGFWIIGG